MDKEALDILSVVRIRLEEEMPYLSTAIWAIEFVESEEVGTMGMDQHWRCFYSAEFIKDTEPKYLEAMLYHEILHLMREHSDRAGSQSTLDPGSWNKATDAAINDDIQDEGFELHSSAILPEDFDQARGKAAEEYYVKLVKGEDEESEMDMPGGGKGEGASDGLYKRPWECDGPGKGQNDSEDVPRGKDDYSSEMVKRKTAEDIKDHQGSSGRGTVPGHIRRAAEEIVNPSVDWRKELTSSVRRGLGREAGRMDYSFIRPSRRAAAYEEFILPGMFKPKPKAAVVIDTSGSMSEQELNSAVSEVKGLMDQTGAKVDLVSCGVNASEIQTVSKISQIDLTGGGGTDMRNGIDKALEANADVIAVITDGHTPWPETKKKGVKLIAILTEQTMDRVPSFMKAIDISEEVWK